MSNRTIVFDWGDTLMRVFPQYSGVMADWPEVACIEYAREALGELHGRYRLVVGSNARESNATEIRHALKRVGLNPFIDEVYTYNETGCRKPDPGFFQRIEQMEGKTAGEMVMVGDEFLADVLGAARAGWKSVWFNPAVQLARGLVPVQSVEVFTLRDLPVALLQPELPTVAEAVFWLQEHGCSYAVLSHVQAVAAYAYVLAVALRRTGEDVDPVLTHRGGLLHDVAKLSSRNGPHVDHAAAGAHFLRERGQADLAEIAYRHILSCITDEKRAPRVWEQKLVYYADKLVEGSRLVPIETRLEALKNRYQIEANLVDAWIERIRELQTELLSKLGWTRDELLKNLADAGYEP